MVTAARNVQNIQKALRHGVVDYIVKPFDAQRLQSSLIAYRERVRLIGESDSLEQKEIDRRVFAKAEKILEEVPKGLEKETLALLREEVKKQTTSFSTEEMARQIGISRVSLRKYLDYLTDMGVLEVKLTYRLAGRPIRLYCYKHEGVMITSK